MNVLITGGCGFLGSNIAAAYIDQGARVTVIDALFRPGSRSNLRWLELKVKDSNFCHYEIDLAEATAVDKVFSERGPFDYICHLGGQVAMTTSLADPRRDMVTNVVGTFNILDATRRLSPKSFVAYSSTNKVYGDLRHLQYAENDTRYFIPGKPAGLDETFPLDFSTPYGCSKGAADQYVRDWFRVYGIKTVVFRHSSIYGGRQFATVDQGWIGWFCQKAVEHQQAEMARCVAPEFTIAGTGKQVRDVLHADDLVDLYSAAYYCQDRVAGEVLNIGGGSGNSLSLLELFRLLARVAELSAPLNFKCTPRRASDQDYFVADIGKAAALLDWKPKVSAEEGIRRMIAWVAQSV